MILFFKKIKHKLITKNRISNYLLYAIGEVILIVVGILLALQINNWNQKRILKNNEIEILKQLELDLKFNLEELTQICNHLEERLNCSNKVLKHLESSNEVSDSLRIWLEKIPYDALFNIANTTYKNIENSDKKILTNDSIRLKTTLMYELEFANVLNLELRFKELKDSYKSEVFKLFKVGPSLTAHGPFEGRSLALNTPIDFMALKNNNRYKNKLVEMINYRVMRVHWLKITIQNLELLIQDVNAEIENQ